MLFVNYATYSLNIPVLSYVLGLRMVIITEWTLACIGVSKLWSILMGVMIGPINIPFGDIAFASGPLSTAAGNMLRLLRDGFNSKVQPTQPALVAKPPDVPLQHLRDVPFTSLFLKNELRPPFKPPPYVPAEPPNPFAPNYSPEYVFGNYWPKPMSRGNEMKTAAQGSQNCGNNEANSETQATWFGIPIKKKQTALPKLKYTPCVQPPLQPTKYRARLTWYLSPSNPEIINDFKIQQLIDFRQNKKIYRYLNSVVYYDNIARELLKRIFVPLAESIASYDAMLSPKSVAWFTPAAVLRSMAIPKSRDVVFGLPEIASFINMNGYTHVEGREYIIQRINALASSSKMQTFRYIPTVTGMPTDTNIIMHIFQQYLNFKEPYAIPPLVPLQGDLFKYLSLYFKSTPELDHWNIF
ncbi:hypothetical protein [Parasitella parasitica]|uniref:Uncharacterized protein n=1 Tax=Parasitella parasitica TaxID=35722 RepID=A0A0B7NUL0_9FUNG|nr:hypothetical protein [Parasitella parasitica]